MSVGLPVTKSELDTRAGDVARAFQRSFRDVVTLKAYLDATPDADLMALEPGYTQGEVTTLKTAINELAQLGTIWTGDVDLPAAHDFRTFVQRLWGVGAF